MKKILILILVLLLVVPLTHADLWDDILSYWAFNQTAGTLVPDHVNGFNNGTASDLEWNTTGKLAQAGEFNKALDYVDINATDNHILNRTNFSISFWFNPHADYEQAANKYIMGSTVTGRYNVFMKSLGDGLVSNIDGDAPINELNLSFWWGNWTHVVITYDSSGDNKVYINGTLNYTSAVSWDWNTVEVNNLTIGTAGDYDAVDNINMTFDEFGIWGRTLSASEASELYNDGVGLTLGIILSNITLNSPEDDFSSVASRDITFNISTRSSVGDIKNVSLYVNGVSNGTEEITGFTNESIFSLQYPVGEYNWSGLVCDTIHVCSWASPNRTFTISAFLENSQTFNNDSTEGSTETFEINISYDNVTYSNFQGFLYYNGTSYTGTGTAETEDTVIFTTDIEIPSVTTETNFTFNWEIWLWDGSVWDLFNSTFNNQTVTNIAIDDCGTFGILLLNYSLKDERTQDFLTAAPENTSIQIDLEIFTLDSPIAIITFSQNYSFVNPAQVCLEGDFANTSQFRMDVQTRYESLNRYPEYHHIQNFTLSNMSLPQNINLFDLSNDSLTERFLITFKNQDFLPVEDTLIDIQRKYVDEGVFKSVEIPKTDQFGQTTGHFDIDSGAIYTIIVSKNGIILATFNNVAVVCQDRIISDCRINLNVRSIGEPFPEWEKVGGITYTMTFNNNTRTITTIFSTTDGSSKTVLVNATKMDRFGNQTVCSDELTSSSGTLTCLIPESFGNVTVVAELFVNGQLITTRIFSILPDALEAFGIDALAMILIMMLTIPLMMVSTAIGLIIGVLVGLFMAAGLMLMKGGTVIGTGLPFIWAIIAAIIIIWKINQSKV